MEQRFDDDDEIDLLALFQHMLKYWKGILLTALVAAIITAAVNIFVLNPVYQANARIYVFPKEQGITVSGLQLGGSLVKDYEYVVTGPDILEKVTQNLSLEESWEDLSKRVSVKTVNSDTRILQISVTGNDRQELLDISNEIVSISSDFIEKDMGQSRPTVIQKPRLLTNPIAPSKKKNILLAFLAGAILPAGISIVKFLINDTVHNSEEVESQLGMKVLAEIPDNRDMSNSMKRDRLKRKNKRRRK